VGGDILFYLLIIGSLLSVMYLLSRTETVNTMDSKKKVRKKKESLVISNRQSANGAYGEMEMLSLMESWGIPCVKNVYIPHKYGFSELDLVAVLPSGLYSIEVKNWGGKVYGNKDSDKWVTYYRNGKSFSAYNPVKQNAKHVERLQRHFSIPHVKSIVVFSNRADLTNVKAPVLSYTDFINSANKLFSGRKVLKDSEVQTLYKKLTILADRDKDFKKRHIDYVRKLKD
jgi:hypothetical protein